MGCLQGEMISCMYVQSAPLHPSFFINQGASGFRRSQLSCGRMLRLASRGFGNREIAFTPCPFGVHAPTRRLLSSFRKPAAHSRRLIGLSSVPRSARHRRHGCFSPQAHSLRLRGEYGARRYASPRLARASASLFAYGGIRPPCQSSRETSSSPQR